jgi:hypothetical protein
MKHPLLVEREYQDAYRRLRHAYFLRCAALSYGALVLVIAAVCALVWPAVDRVMLLIVCSTGLTLCLAVADQCSRRRALQELSARGIVPRGWRPPSHEWL